MFIFLLIEILFIICLLKCYSAKLMNEEEKPNNHRQQQEKIYLKKYMMEKLRQTGKPYCDRET